MASIQGKTCQFDRDDDKEFEKEQELERDKEKFLDECKEVYLLVKILFEMFEKESSQKTGRLLCNLVGNFPRKISVL